MQLVLVWNVLAHLAGIYLFTRGFLLTRLSLPNVSSPADFPAHEPDFARLNASSQPSLQTHTSAILLLIDALRFDFISPHPPHPPSPHHHNVLTLPRDLSATRPRHSLIFDAYSDPPTTTLQRVKALMTGTLPTFVDIGASLGPAENATELAEDSILKQMNILGKKIAFMGDDTWLSVYPSSFTRNMSFPCESFNVEDLHTVDDTVISHLFPLLEQHQHHHHQQSPAFDFLIAHFLGVDHIGHRLGPDHPAMRHKLHQMNDVLKRVVDRMHPSTLLVVLGDHGMDSSGDHGGDGLLETSSAMWFYSKGPALINSTLALPDDFLTYQSFPGTHVPHRSIQQIDLLPSLSLLLGLPIPYNNLGSVVPELFWRDRKGAMLERALEANARQLWRFLRTYRESSLGGELDDVWEGLLAEWEGATSSTSATTSAEEKQQQQPHKLSLALLSSTRRALAACRAIWAQFNALLMALGLVSLATCLIACWRTLDATDADHHRQLLRRSFFCSAAAASLGGGGLAYLGGLAMSTGVSLPHWILFFASVGSSVGLIFPATKTTATTTTSSILSFSGFPIILALHSLTFVSNSFTFWEDRLLPFLILSSLVPYLRLALLRLHHHHPKKGLRTHHDHRLLLLHLGLFALSVRLMALSTVCREEQQPYCGVTFFQAGSGPPWIVLVVLGLLLLVGGGWWVGVGIVRAVAVGVIGGGRGWGRGREGRRSVLSFLWILRGEEVVVDDEDDDMKITRVHRRYVVVPTLMAGTLFWLIEWIDSAGLLVVDGGGGDDASTSSSSSSLMGMVSFLDRLLGGIRSEDLRTLRTCVAWLGVGWCLVGAWVGWICCYWSRSSKSSWGGGRDRGRRWRTPYTILWTTFFGLTYMCTQLTGQVVLLLCAVAIVSFGEVIRCARVARRRGRDLVVDDDDDDQLKFTDMTPLALLSLVTFYATGHQANVPSIQWKAAFVLCEKVHYPLSVITMVLNELGGVAVVVLGVGEILFVLLVVRDDDDGGDGDGDDGGDNDGDNDDERRKQKQKEKEKRPAAPVVVVRALLSLSTHFLVLLLGSSVGTAILRRHLMVWKVFAPRFMTALVQVLVVDLVALVVALFA